MLLQIFRLICLVQIGFVVLGCNQNKVDTEKSQDATVAPNNKQGWDRFVGKWRVAEVINKPFGDSKTERINFDINLDGVCELEVIFADGSKIVQNGELLIGSKSIIIFDDSTFAASFYKYQFDGVGLTLVPANSKSGSVRFVR